ncbi:MAG: hypothetical protein H7Z72_06255 [Bacteroidetes bacterium]|nr:hypothetical protein [Fibrella sp.]
MKQVLTIISLVVLLISCRSSEIEPGEVEGTITGYVVADNFAKSCSVGGLQVEIRSDTYTLSNAVPVAYQEPNSWPISVWIRYQPDIPDTCTQSTNRVKILSIRKR